MAKNKEKLKVKVPKGKEVVVQRTRRRQKRNDSFASYIFKVLRQVHPNTGISTKAMRIMNSFITDFFERLAAQAGEFSRSNHRNGGSTLSSRDVQVSVCFILPGFFGKLCY